MKDMCLYCQVNEKRISSFEGFCRYIEQRANFKVSISPSTFKRAGDGYYRRLCKEAGGLYLTLDGAIDYSTNPPIFKPDAPRLCGRLAGAIILDDFHNMQEKAK